MLTRKPLKLKETGVRVGRSRPLWPESETELESVKFGRIRLWPRVVSYYPSAGDDFGRTVILPSENIERQEEKGSGVVQIKLKRHLVMEFPLNKVSEIILRRSRSFCDFVSTFKDRHTNQIQRI